MIQIVSFLSLLITAVLVAFFARRVLGAPIGWPRSIIVGALMLSPLGSALPRLSRTMGLADASGDVANPVIAGVLFALILALAFLLSIAALVVLELIVPTGSIPNPFSWSAVCGSAYAVPGATCKSWPSALDTGWAASWGAVPP
jgi:ubiquinone biosynthesis protein